MIAVEPNNPEWYTPQYILERVYATLGGVSLDPCCNLYGTPNVAAERHYRLPTDGLSEPWGEGNTKIFLNPPYGRAIGKWTKKLTEEFLAGGVKSAITLVPVKSDTKWWTVLLESASCWCAIRGRIRFDSPSGGNGQTGTFASALVLLTKDEETTSRFMSLFEDMGHIWWSGKK